MSSYIRFDTFVDETSTHVDRLLNLRSDNRGLDAMKIAKIFERLAGGTGNGSVRVVTGAVRASGTLTFTGNPLNTETFTINGVTFTAKTSGATGDQWNIGANATANAAAVVTMVNASTTAKIKGVIKAASAAGVVTFTCLVPGVIGNLCTLTESLTNATVSGANFASGTENTPSTIARGRAA